jgi:UDP-2,3-diacylglucosamine hydrolase
MKKVFFISDIHLGFGTKQEDLFREKKLIEFLENIKNECSELYIVGDLFDFWFEYRRVVPKGYFKVLSKLSDFIENGIPIHYLVGNHDCLLRDYFEKEIGLKVYWNEIEREILGKKFFIHHGDGLLKNDTGYKILKAILRNKFNQWLFSLVHPDFGVWLGSVSSNKSRSYTSKKDYGKKDSLLEYATKKIEQGFDYVIFGHIHKLVKIQINSGYYINLGDWINNYSYGVFDGNEFNLKQLNINDEGLNGRK